jgi:hypothetical protein
MLIAPINRVVLFTLLLTLSSAYAGPKSAEVLTEEAIASYLGGHFEKSIKLLDQAQRATSEEKLLTKIHLYRGLCHGVLGNNPSAQKAFKQALVLDPTLALDPTETKEALLALFGRARQELSGTIQVESDRSEARLTIDNKETGRLPYRGSLPIGKHTIEVMTPDQRYSFSDTVVIYANRATSVSAKLRPFLAELKVASKPLAALVLLDQDRIGYTPLQRLLQPGQYQLRLELDGYHPYLTHLQVSAGQNLSIAAELQHRASTPSPKSAPKEGFKAPRKRRRVWTWVAASGALLGAGTGLGLGLWARTGWEQYQEAARTGDEATYYSLRDSIPNRAMGSTISFSLAGAFALTAVVLYFVEGRSAR